MPDISQYPNRTKHYEPVKEVFVEEGVVVGQRLGQPGQPRGRDLLQGRLNNDNKTSFLLVFLNQTSSLTSAYSASLNGPFRHFCRMLPHSAASQSLFVWMNL